MSCTNKNIAVLEKASMQQHRIKEALNIAIGQKEKDNHIRSKIWDFLYDWMNNDPAFFDRGMPELFLNNIRAYIDEIYGPGVFSKELLDQGTHTSYGVLNTLNKYKRKLSKLDKGTTNFMRSWWFPATIGKYADKYGIMGNLVQQFQAMSDRVGQIFLKNSNAIEQSYKKLTDLLSSKINLDFSKDMMDGIKEIDGHPIFTKDGKKIVLLKGIYDKYNRLSGFKTDKGEVSLNDIDTTTFSMDTLNGKLQAALVAKYANELVHKIADGQIRYVKPVNYNELSPRDIANIGKQLREHDTRKIIEEIKANEEGREKKKVREPYFHQVKTSDANYVYLMLYTDPFKKQDSGTTFGDINKEREEWKAVLYSKEDNVTGNITYYWNSNDIEFANGFGKDYSIDLRYAKDMPDFKKILKEGFYEAERNDSFGYILNKEGRPIPGSVLKSYTDFSYMQNTPNYSAFNAPGHNIWAHIKEIRHNFNPMNQNSITYKISKKIKTQGDELISLFELAKDKIGEEAFDKILQTYNIRTTFWEDKAGNLHTLNSSFYTTKETYSPNMYEDKVIRDMLDETIEDMKASLINEENEERIEEKEKAIEELERMRDYSDNKDIPTEYKDVFTKHRKSFTDPMRRRMDGKVFSDYIDRNARIILRNDMMITLLRSILLTHNKHEGNDALIKSNTDYMVNLYKTTIGDATAQAHIFKFDGGNETVVKILKKLPWNKGKEITAEYVDNMIKRWGSWVSLFALDWSSALTNRTQSISYFARIGGAYFRQVHKDINSSDPAIRARTDYIINSGGTRNLMNMLSDVMFTGGQDVDLMSEGPLSLGGWALITLPLALTKMAATGNLISAANKLRFSGFPFKSVKEYVDLVSLGRKGFIDAVVNTRNESAENLKKYIEAWESNRVDELSKELKKVKKITDRARKRKTTSVKQRRVNELAGLFYDLATSNSKDPKVLEERIKRIVPELSNDAIRVAVTWKLGAMFEQLKGVAAFTGSEQSVRDEVYLGAIYYARDMGYLGPKGEIRSVQDSEGNIIEYDDRLVSPAAAYIGRMAVYTHAFGMSNVYLPEAYRGIGKILMQYKGYFVQQTKLESRILRAYRDSKKEGESQILRALKVINDHVISPKFFGKQKPQIDLRQQDIEAITFVRTLAGRGAASMISAFLFDVKMLNYVLDKVGSGMFLKGIRGAESPSLSLFLRTFGRIALFAALGSFDDDEFDFGTSIEALTRILLPPIISILGEQAIDIIKDFID